MFLLRNDRAVVIFNIPIEEYRVLPYISFDFFISFLFSARARDMKG